MSRLTAAQVKAVRHRGGRKRGDRHHDGAHGLFLQVMPSGSKQWMQRLTCEPRGKRSDYCIGTYPGMGLGEARRKAFENALAVHEYRRAVERGERPGLPPFERNRRVTVARRNGQPVPDFGRVNGHGITFAAAYEACIVERATRWKNPDADLRSWRASLRDYMAGFSGFPVARVDIDHLREAIAPLTLATADKTLGRIVTVFNWAVAGKHRPDNPARVLRDTMSGLKREAVEHRKAMPYAEVPAFFARLLAGGTGADARGALALVVLTGLRSGEASGARWEEIDLEARTLVVPASRMKDGRPHTVPLPEAACAVLRAAGPRATGAVFRAPRGGPVAGRALRELLADLGADATVHGFRASLKTWCGESRDDIPREVAEAILAHRIGSSAEQAYARGTMLARRRAALNAYADFVCGACLSG